jgi:TonB family protein
MNKKAKLFSASVWLALLAASAPAAPAQASGGQNQKAATWAVADSDGGAYVFELGPGGKFSFTSSGGTSGVGTWRQDGQAIRIEVNKGFVEYSGTVEGRRVEGRAKNKRGREWMWWGVKQEAAPVAASSAFPTYPGIAVAARAEGVVTVDVQVDSAGNVTSAEAVGGHPLLQQAATKAAKSWKFAPTEDAGTLRAVQLVFAFRLVLTDCSKAGRAPEPSPALITAYRAEVRSGTGCVEYQVDGTH